MQHATQEDLLTSSTLACTVSPADLPRLCTVLQAGFFATAPAGASVAAFLRRLPGFSDDYIEHRLQTVFINGDAIDNLEQPLSGHHLTMALSAALPGLAGAIFRRNSPASPLRSGHSADAEVGNEQAMVVLVKLFNVVAVERGPELLRAGVRLRAADLSSFLAMRPGLLAGLVAVTLDGTACGADLLPAHLATLSLVTLTVSC